MNYKGLTTGVLLAFLFAGTSPVIAHAQLTTIPDGGNRKASVSEWIGVTNVIIGYSRPGVKGREGQIWGKLVPTGFTDQGFGTSKAAPWRAGANENTTIEFSTDVTIEGQPLPAGKYGFFIAYDSAECTLIFSRNSSSWGSFFYDPKDDALHIRVKPVAIPNSVEWLTYSFRDQKENGATVALEWEKLSIPFRIEADVVGLQIASFRRELHSNKGFTWNAWVTAAQFCAQHRTNLEEALQWSDYAINANFVGQKNFQTLSTRAQILALQGRTAEADAVMKEALPMGQIADVHQYARLLLAERRQKDAFGTFKMNYDRHPNEFTTNMGMARAWSAMGDYKKALTFLQKAQAQAPDSGNRANIAKSMLLLQQGKDIN